VSDEQCSQEMTRDELVSEIEQLQVQLAGCLTAAEGHAYCDKDAYGWCVAGQAVVDLRAERDRLANEVRGE